MRKGRKRGDCHRYFGYRKSCDVADCGPRVWYGVSSLIKGHLFGADHDGGAGGNSCPSQGFVMQAFQTLRSEEILEFSTCSESRIARFRPQANCIV
jgi:hypothetical protein